MKKRLLFIIALTLNCILHSYGVEISGIYYQLNSSTFQAEVVESPYYNRYSGSIDIPSTVTYGGTTYLVTQIGFRAFYDCKDITSISIPNSLTAIRTLAFSGCTIKEIMIPDSVTRIEDRAFLNCFELKTVTMGTGIKGIGESAFTNCSNLEKVIVKDLASWCGIYFESMGSNPLYYAHHLYSDENTEITELVIPDGTEIVMQNAFFGCNNINSVTIPNSVKEIGHYAFFGWDKLKSVEIPYGVTKLNGFSSCTNLTSVSIPNSVKTIGDGAFMTCQSLTSIDIPNSVEMISEYAFKECNNMKSITLGNGIRRIGHNVFDKCKELADVYCYAERVPNTYDETFDKSIIKNVTLHVPETSVNDYAAKDPWNGFKEIVAIPSSGIGQVSTIETSVKCEGDQLTIEGIDNGLTVELYSLNGEKRGSAVGKNGAARIDTNVRPGSIVVVKMGDKSVKVIVK